MDICIECGTKVPDNLSNCPTCDKFIGYPNVRTAERRSNTNALEARYDKAWERAKLDGNVTNLKSFEAAMHKTCVVMNVYIDFLCHFLTSEKELYSTYNLQVRGKIRKPAIEKNDKHRRTIDAMLFGGYGEEIRYAALSLDGIGPCSYGPYSMQLRDIAIRKRASLLENNSFHFVKKLDIRPGDEFPHGYRSTWNDRHKLAVAKLADKINSKTAKDDFAKILLFSEGDFNTDEFIEVHIYGSFDNNAIESVKGSSKLKNKSEKALLAIVKDHLKKKNKKWFEI